ncbi:FMN-linked oxidoreductase [Sporormia fimetaria CBS 119925]|uniref:Dihydroorotate dehydrogenase (fumarate) n=1 Tax=Sporormia fimetaria CBS 119925 TaxID=1340428 RepID=A0A6A6VF32_9PLEO|nr:FMN-linked oxidoreductase [Sporormia fimetaria CBS 119925]
MNRLKIEPPLLNTANPWCTTLEQLQALYSCPHTGAVTTRTSLPTGFPHDDSVNQYTFYEPSSHKPAGRNPKTPETVNQTASLNTLGYSPKVLAEYLGFVKTISDNLPKSRSSEAQQVLKPFIISVTGTESDVVESYKMISQCQQSVRMPLAMEVNLSCPNIVGKPPPAYTKSSLLSYLSALQREIAEQQKKGTGTLVPIGIKTPPYTYHDQFVNLISALQMSTVPGSPCLISFITATNTLGSSLVLKEEYGKDTTFENALGSANGTGIGGLAGAPLHPLALGNVRIISGLLEQHSAELGHIQIIGAGGVDDYDGYLRMRAVGAAAVGLGTALGRKGLSVFEEINKRIAASTDARSKL